MTDIDQTAEQKLRAVHVSFYLHPEERSPDELLAAWPTLVRTAAAAARAGAAVSVIQAAAEDRILHTEGVDFHFVRLAPPPGWRRRRVAAKLASPAPILRCLERLDPDVVLVSGLAFPLQVRALRKALPQTAVLVQDHADVPPSGWRSLLHRRCFSGVAGVLFTAREQAEPFFHARVLEPTLPVFEVPEDSSNFVPGDQHEARRSTGLKGDPCLLWLGRLDRNKDPLMVLEALKSAAVRLPDPQLWCCYQDAPLEQEVRRAAAADETLSKVVHFIGPRPHAEIETLCRAADFLVQGSRREGSGYAVIEALACGLTPLVTDIPSFRKLTGHGAVGALATPGDAEAFAKNLVEWSQLDRVQLRAAARRWFEQELSYEVLGRGLHHAYREARGSR